MRIGWRRRAFGIPALSGRAIALLTAGAVALAVGAWVTWFGANGGLGGPTASVGPRPAAESASALGSVSPVSTASAVASERAEAAAVDLGQVSWWDTQTAGFGVTGFEPQPLPAVPEAYRQLRVGTLDGRVTAVRTLPFGWSLSYASGPVDDEVLVVADDGARSVISAIHGPTGAERTILETTRMVPAAALSAAGDTLWYVELDRDSGIDRGLWRATPDGRESSQVVPGPLGEPFEQAGITVWQLVMDPAGRFVAVQWCFGQVRCTTHVVDVETSDVRTTTQLGWPFGFTDTYLVTQGLSAGHQTPRGVDLESFDMMTWRASGFETGVTVRADDTWWLVGAQGAGARTFRLELVPGAGTQPLPADGDVTVTEFHLPYDAGVGPLPDGWALRWPEAFGTWPGEPVRSNGLLINLETGERIELAPFMPDLTSPSCAVPAPAQTPMGLASGASRSELRDGVRYVQWSQGQDVVTLAVGTPVIGTPAELGEMPATEVRGHPARVVLIGDEGVEEVALVWQEGDCTYTAWLAPGTSVDAAIEYAARY
jgi:hypothetical protein